MTQDSLADLEQKAAQRRAAVMGALGQLAVQMQPANLAREATEAATAKASEAAQAVAEKAATPKGVGFSIAAVAAGAALIAGWRTRFFGLLPEKVQAPQPVLQKVEPVPPPEPEQTQQSEPSLKGTISAAAGLGAALAIGTALSKMLPVSERERDLLQGVGEELKTQFAAYAQSLIQSQTAPGWVNLATTVLGVLAARNETARNETKTDA